MNEGGCFSKYEICKRITAHNRDYVFIRDGAGDFDTFANIYY